MQNLFFKCVHNVIWTTKKLGHFPIMARRNFKIYALIDPLDFSVFYVGRTSQKPGTRLNKHIQDSGNQTPKGKKIKKIEEEWGTPSLVVLEQNIFSEKEAFIREVFWIEMFNKCGAALTNASIDFGGTFFLTESGKVESNIDAPEKPQAWSIEFAEGAPDNLLDILTEDFFRFEDCENVEYVSTKTPDFKIDPDKRRAENAKAGRPLNHKMPFTKQELFLVQHLYSEGKNIAELANFFQRDEKSIRGIIDGRYSSGSPVMPKSV